MKIIFALIASFFLFSTAHATVRIDLDKSDELIQVKDKLPQIIEKAKKGDATAAFEYAERLRKGLPGKTPDYVNAAYWYKIAAQKGKATAAITLAEMYESGQVKAPTKDAAKDMYAYAYRILKVDAEKGRPSAATNLGRMFFHGKGVQADANLAVKWLQKGVDLGSAQAKLALGRLTIWNSTPGYNAEQALEMLHEAAEAGLGSAWLQIGLAYSGAYGGRINHPRAADAFRKAHESKASAEGTRLYGISHMSGFGVPKNEAKGATLLQTAAARGNSEAMYNTALTYRHGLGVRKDKKQELKWMRKAAAYKVPDANYYLGLAYRDGDGVRQSKDEALKYFKRAQIKKHVMAIRDYKLLAGELAAKEDRAPHKPGLPFYRKSDTAEDIEIDETIPASAKPPKLKDAPSMENKAVPFQSKPSE